MEEENEEHLKRFAYICTSISKPSLPVERRRDYLLKSYGIDPHYWEEEIRRITEARIEENLRREMAIEWSIREFEFALKALNLSGWPQISTPFHSDWGEDLRSIVSIEAGITNPSDQNPVYKDGSFSDSHRPSKENPPWLRGDWVSAARLVRSISGEILQNYLDDPNTSKKHRERIEETLGKCEDYSFITDWKDLVRVVPVTWETSFNILQPYGDRGEKYVLEPEKWGSGEFETARGGIKLLCIKAAPEETWVCLPNGINDCRKYHQRGIPTNLWKMAERPFKSGGV
tara:strand:- start:2788 stop:3648 length:861 start_codon:yes stop_codon:yes gene_type:complete